MSNGKSQGRSAPTSKRSAPINAKAVQDTTARKASLGARTPAVDPKRLPVKVAPPDRRAYTGPPSSKSVGQTVREGVDKVVRKVPVISTIVEKLDETTRKMGR